MPTHEEYIKNKKYYLDYYQNNNEKIKAKERAYKNKNRKNINKNAKEYYKRNSERIKIYQKWYRENNKEKKRHRDRKYYLTNFDKIKSHHKKWYEYNKKVILTKCKIYRDLPENKLIKKLRDKKYIQKNGKRIYQQRKRRMKRDIKYRIIVYLRSRFNNILKKYTKTGKIMSSRLYGIDYNKIIEHLKPFPSDISKYHIDHIKPLSSFNFVNNDGTTNFEEIKRAFAPENHQWLKAEDNLKKKNRVEKQILLTNII